MRPESNPFRRAFWFGQVDARPFCLFRIVFALLILKDALYHLPLAYDFYSDSGIVTRSVLLDLARVDRFSLMDAMPHVWMAVLFFLLWAAVAVALLVGYKTRLATILNFIIMFSIHERDVYILSGSDTMMRAMSFWMMFVPVGACYSWDAWQARRAGQSPSRFMDAFPARMMQLQVMLVYVFAGWLKLVGSAWTQGEALGYVFQLDTMLLPPGALFRSIAPDWLMRLITFGTILFELSFLPLVLLSFGHSKLRAFVLISGLLLHGGIGLMLSIPDFSLVMLISYIVLFDPRWMDALESRLSPYIRTLLPNNTPSEPASAPSIPLHSLWGKGLGDGGIKLFLALFLTIAMLGAIWWNVDYMGEFTTPVAPMPDEVRSVMWYTGLWQYWDLFAPLPLQVDGWISIPGTFEDGTVLELRTGQPPSDEPIHFLIGPFVRWGKFEATVFDSQYEPILLSWGRYYCRIYNTERALPEGHRLATLEIRYRYRRAHAPDAPTNPLSTDILWTHWCYDEYAP